MIEQRDALVEPQPPANRVGSKPRHRLQTAIDSARTPADPQIIELEVRRVAETEIDNSQPLVVRHALDRMRATAQYTLVAYRQWQEAAREVGELRVQLAAADLRLEAHLNRWAEVSSSRGFKLLQNVYAIRLALLPQGSRRELLAAAGLRWVRRAGGLLKRVWPIGAKDRSAAVKQIAVETTTPSPLAPLPERERGRTEPTPSPPAPLPQRERGHTEPIPSPPAPLPEGDGGEAVRDDVNCFPLRWPLKDVPTTSPINLILLSASQRSGSTLLQRICNARKGTLIWGEHGALLRQFRDIYTTAAYFSALGSQQRNDYFGQGENPNLWIADMCPEVEYAQQAVVDSARAFLAGFYGQYRGCHDILGFKEVHYDRPELELLRRCCPDAPILLLVRNPLNTWKSTPRHWSPSLDIWIDEWNQSVRCFREFAAIDATSHLIRYEDVIAKEPRTMAILAQTAKVSDKEVSMVLGHKIGSVNAGLSEPEREKILDRSREGMEAFGYR